MGLETAAVEHACNVVRRQIQDEFPDLTLFYLVHTDGQRQKAVEARSVELRQHPAHEAFLPHLAQEAEKPAGPEFSGISIKAEKKLISFLAKDKILACFFVDADKLETADEARRHALFLAWQALALIEEYRSGKKDTFHESAGIIAPKPDKALLAWKNMLADAFSVLMLEMEKKRDSIGALGRYRSTMALTTKVGSTPELYPFPLVYEATRILYHDMAKNPGPGGPVKRALEMIHEISETFDRTSVRQWWAFSRTAQEMAWLGMEPGAILGAAVYNSEDPYARATAYIIAEALNIQTLIPASIGSYNPFAESETNERHHMKAAEESFRAALTKSISVRSSAGFIDEAARQNKRLLNGNPIGWCAYPTLCAEIAYNVSPETAKGAFDKAMTEISWEMIENLMRLIIQLRREGVDVTPDTLAARLQEIDGLKFLAPCFMKRV